MTLNLIQGYRKWISILIFIVLSTLLMSQDRVSVDHLLTTFEKVELPFDISPERINSVYQKVSPSDSIYLLNMIKHANLEKVNPISESAYGVIDEQEELNESEIIGGSVILESDTYVIICFLISDTGYLISLDTKTGAFISGIIAERYIGFGHAQIGRYLKIDSEKNIQIEEVCWGRSVDDESSYELNSVYTINDDGYFILKLLNYKN